MVENLELLELVDDEDEDKAEIVVLGLQEIREQPMKILSEEEKMKWSSVSWPSSLADAYK